jgi:hypothetical protein
MVCIWSDNTVWFTRENGVHKEYGRLTDASKVRFAKALQKAAESNRHEMYISRGCFGPQNFDIYWDFEPPAF